MAPVDPKRRVKSIRKLGDNPTAKVRKSRTDKQYSKAYICKLLKKVLKRRANVNDSVHLIYKTYRRMIKMACELVARRHRKISLKEARIAMAKMIPREVAMSAIREFRQQSATEAPKTCEAPSCSGATSTTHFNFNI